MYLVNCLVSKVSRKGIANFLVPFLMQARKARARSYAQETQQHNWEVACEKKVGD